MGNGLKSPFTSIDLKLGVYFASRHTNYLTFAMSFFAIHGVVNIPVPLELEILSWENGNDFRTVLPWQDVIFQRKNT